MQNTIPTTRNEAWGFFGSIADITEPAAAWLIALPAIAKAADSSLEAAREFLDSRHGRHFADDVRNAMSNGTDPGTAIDITIARWMHWTISRHTSRETGIPQGLPHLTGLVTYCEIMAEED